MPFEGFPRNVRATPVPDPFFNSLLEEIEDLAELKVTMRLIWLLGQRRGGQRYVTGSVLLNDGTLQRAMGSLGGNPRERIQQGLGLALTRGTLIRHSEPGEAGEVAYLLNTADNRRRLSSLRVSVADGWPEHHGEGVEAPPAATVDSGAPSIYELYENNIGTIGPLMAQQLAEAEDRYPPPWLVEAFQIAIYENKRSWSYISAILRRWAAQGRYEADTLNHQQPGGHPGVGIKAGATLWEEEGRQHGKPGRHTEEDERSRQARSRQRR